MNAKVSATEWATAKRKLAAGKKAMENLQKLTFYHESDQACLAIDNLLDVCETLMRAME